MNGRPAGARPAGQIRLAELSRAPAEAIRAQKSHSRPMTDGPEHVDTGTLHFFHTSQRRSNRAPAIILEGSMSRDETGVKGKSFIAPNSIEPMGVASDSGH